jgi:hypothetical protein
MSDFGRKDFHTKAKEGLIPDSTKSTSQKTKETFTDAGDKLARYVCPSPSPPSPDLVPSIMH